MSGALASGLTAGVRPSGPTTPPPPPPAREGILRDRGVVRRDRVRARGWLLVGTGRVTGDVEVDAADLRGQVSVGGKLAAGAFAMRGSLEVLGAVDVTGPFSVTETLRASVDVHARSIELKGLAKVGGAVRADDRLYVHGRLKAASVRASKFLFAGEVDLAGDLEAGVVDGVIDRDSRATTVRANSVTIRPKPGLLPFALPVRVPGLTPSPARFTVDRIEAETVVLSGVNVGYLRANQIVLGRDSEVTRVDGAIVSCHPTSHVGPVSRSAAPYGLTR